MTLTLQELKHTLSAFAEGRGHSHEHLVDDVVLLQRGVHARVAPGHILERCPIGFRVRHSLELSPGDVVEVLWTDGGFVTEVMWSEQTREGCVAGLRIQEEPRAA